MQKITAKKIIQLIAGVATVAIGVALSIRANLGTSPVTSFPYNLGLIIGLSTGTCSAIVHAFFIVLQIILLRKEFKLFNLLQLPLGIFFGTVVDLAGKLFEGLHYTNYVQQMGLCLLSVVLVALGVSLEVEANIILLAIEGFAQAAAYKSGKKFGDCKSFTDISLVAGACIIGLIFRHQIAGVREGTVIAAVGVGQISKIFKKLLFSEEKNK